MYTWGVEGKRAGVGDRKGVERVRERGGIGEKRIDVDNRGK